MTRHLHEPANALLYRALDLPPEERQRFVADACEGEPELLELVRTLLSRIDLLDEFLEAPLEVPAAAAAAAAAAAPSAPRPGPIIVPHAGDAVGAWRVVRELGRDGMDAILLVERNDDAARQSGTMRIAQVSGQDGDALERFQRARQQLTNLNHTAIARPVDAGATADGRPYFVIAHSDGVPIDQHCADAGLTPRQRVALFAQVCHAVHYAHQHLVIHRDLKPANIVVAPDGSPKLLNFGVAGESGSWLPAPLFASPEQLAGQPLSVSSDVYSLGAILYCLVSGRSPNADEAAGIISTRARPAPTAPSDAVTQAAERHYPALPELAADDMLHPSAELARQLRGDLDQILLKAIDLDPAQRYASADALAGDLERYLADEAPQAIAPERSERRRGLLQRHPLGIAAAALAVCSLVAASGAALWHARAADQARAVAEQRAAQASRPASGMLAEVNDALGKTPAAARDKFVGSAAAYLGQLADVRRAAGDLPGAQQAASLAHSLAEKQAQANSDDLRWRRQLSATGGQVGAILVEQGKTAEGLVELRKALALREELAAKDVANYAAARDVADAHASIAAAMMATMDYVRRKRK